MQLATQEPKRVERRISVATLELADETLGILGPGEVGLRETKVAPARTNAPAHRRFVRRGMAARRMTAHQVTQPAARTAYIPDDSREASLASTFEAGTP